MLSFELILVWEVWTCQSFVAKVWTWVWDLDPGRPLKNRSQTAQILLEKPFKNHRKKWAVFERFSKQDLSGWAVFPKNRLNRPNRSNLAGKPLKPLKSWAVFERDLDPGSSLVAKTGFAATTSAVKKRRAWGIDSAN